MLKKIILICAIVAIGIQNARGGSIAKLHSHKQDARIKVIGGEIAERGQFPYQIQLQFFGTHYCGGAILNENWIVTAAHCSDVGIPLNYVAVANQHNIYLPEGQERRHRVSKIFTHPKYDANALPNDIALMKVAKPFKFDDKVSPIALPAATYTPAAGVNGTVSGWGATSEGGLPPVYLHYVNVPFVDFDDCEKAYREIDNHVVESMICAGKTGKDACQGDSGGPLAVDLNGSPHLVGVVSWGEGCGREGFPGVYTEITKFLDWINETIENN